MQYFRVESLHFLCQLAANNRFDWFDAHREGYESLIRQPFLRLLADLDAAAGATAPGYAVDLRKAGGSLFRIQRNTRLSMDKRPYQEWQGARILQRDTRTDVTAELSLRIGPHGQSEVGGGMLYPSTENLSLLRDAIAQCPDQWLALENRLTTSGARFAGPALKRCPRGYEGINVCLDALKRKACFATFRLEDHEVCSPHLLDLVQDRFKYLEELSIWISHELAARRTPFY